MLSFSVPSSPESSRTRGNWKMRAKRISQAADELAARHRDDERAIEQMLVRVLRQAVKGRSALAARLRRIGIVRAKRAIERKPTSRLWILLGDLYTQPARSKACYEKALRIAPGDSEAAYELAKAAYWEGRIRKAETLITRVVDGRLPVGLEDDVLDLAARIFRASGNRTCERRARQRCAYWRAKLTAGLRVRDVDPDWDKPDPLEAGKDRPGHREGQSHLS